MPQTHIEIGENIYFKLWLNFPRLFSIDRVQFVYCCCGSHDGSKMLFVVAGHRDISSHAIDFALINRVVNLGSICFTVASCGISVLIYLSLIWQVDTIWTASSFASVSNEQEAIRFSSSLQCYPQKSLVCTHVSDKIVPLQQLSTSTYSNVMQCYQIH